MTRLAYAFILLAACATGDDEIGDGIDDQDVTILPNTPEARGVLRVANELTFHELDVDVALPANTARSIVAKRPFATIAALDAAPYVGSSAFTKLLAYARAHGYVVEPSRISACPTYTVPEPAVCGDEQWSFERPTPTGQTLRGVTTFAANDVWAVGGGGSVMHFDGTTWKLERTPVCEELTAMWGTSATNLWAVGHAGRIVHRTARGWTLVESGTCEFMSDVWGSPSGTIWIASRAGVLAGNETQGFTVTPLPGGDKLNAIYGFSDTDIWGLAYNRIFHFDGTTWTKTVEGNWALDAIWGSDPDHLVVGGHSWDDNMTAAWTFGRATAATPTKKVLTGNRTPAVGGTGPNDMWLAEEGMFFHFDGTAWTYVPGSSNVAINEISMRSPTDGWAVGESGARLHWDGTAWSVPSGEPHGNSNFFALSATDAWMSTFKGLLHWDGTTWTSAPGVTGFFNDVWASSPSDVWAVGLDVKHFDGTAWSVVTLPQTSGLGQGGWYTVGGTGPSDIWVGGSTGNYGAKLAHWNGTAWAPVSVGVDGRIQDILAFAPNNVWLATDKGLVHWDGNIWSLAGPLNTGALFRVFGSGPNDLWTVGQSVYHYNGNTWSEAIHGASSLESFKAGFARAPNDVWVGGGGVLGGNSKLAHWDGTRWTTHLNASPGLLLALGATGSTIWAGDSSGGVLRFRAP